MTTRQCSEKNCHRFQTKQRHQMGRLPNLNRQMILIGLTFSLGLLICCCSFYFSLKVLLCVTSLMQPLFVCHNSIKDYLDDGSCAHHCHLLKNVKQISKAGQDPITGCGRLHPLLAGKEADLRNLQQK